MTDGTGGGRVTPCADPNRETNTDGSCGADCKDGYEPDTTPNSGSECIAVANDDPNDCASENKTVNADDTCGSCLAGYIDDGTGVCIPDESEPVSETPWILYGGIAAVALVFFLKK